MTRKYIPIEEVARAWMEDPAFRAAYDLLEDEFALRCGDHQGAL